MTTRALVVVGAGGHGREVAHAFLQNHPARDFLGFLDDVCSGSTPEGWPIIGKVLDWTTWKHAEFVVGINDARAKRSVVNTMKSLGDPTWGSVIHPTVSVQASVKTGYGVVILGGVEVTVNVTIGAFASINRLVALAHDCELGDYTSIAPCASISGNVTLCQGVEIGTGACIREGVTLGTGSMIGMGSIVVKDVPANTLVVGNPAKPLRELEPW